MDVRELRIGNFVSLFGLGETVEFPLTEPRFIRVLNGEYKVEPIPLTEEWLVKFGFEKVNRGYKEHFCINDFQIEMHGDKFPVRIWGGESAPQLTQYIGHKTKHVHQLQNIYFALTGEELTIKQ